MRLIIVLLTAWLATFSTYFRSELLPKKAAPPKEYIITNYGASTDSTKLNTKAIQQAIDKASAAGGGTIVVPKGVFLSGALFFKPKTQLQLLAGAKLKGSDDIADYPLIPSRMEGQKLDYYAALVNATKVNGFTITGPGIIDGNGLKFWKGFWAHRDSMAKAHLPATNLEVHRPRLLFIWGCDNVTMKDVKLRNAGFWTTHLYQCNNVLIEGCDIRSPFRPVKAPSTDGIDIDVCRKVTIRGCYISVNDDGVCIKGGKGPTAQKLPENGPVEDILVENCTFGEVHAALTCGSECIHANRITMRNCKMDHDRPVLLFKMRPDTYQLYENITIDGITGKCGTLVTLSPWTQFFNLAGSAEKPFGTIRNIRISNVNVQAREFALLAGNPTDKVSNIVFKNVTATSPKSTFTNKYPSIVFDNVTLNGAPVQAAKADAASSEPSQPLRPD
jgi:polygalacturonase